MTTWNQRGRKTIAAKKPMAARNIAVTLPVNAGMRKSLSGTSGSWARLSTKMNAARTINPRTISPPTVGSVHSPDCLFVNPMRIGTSAPVRSAAPA